MARDELKPVFNIIFVPGTVRYLRLAVASLLHFSGYSFRLVANGLGEAERRLLADYCDSSPRLEYFDYPVGRMLDHGTMLNVLFQREASPWFAMADSDIFAVAPFEAGLESALEECDIFSSCLPLSMPPGMELSGFSGRCHRCRRRCAPTTCCRHGAWTRQNC